MARPLTPAEREQFLAQPQVGVLSVADLDGGRPPLTVPVWHAYQPGGELTFFTGTQGRAARKTRLLERAGKLSFCVQQPEYPYKYVTAECTVVKADRAPGAEQVLPAARGRRGLRGGRAVQPGRHVRAVHRPPGPLAELRLRRRRPAGRVTARHCPRRRLTTPHG